MGTRCTRCGIHRAMFAVGYKPGPDGEAFADTGLCVSCRHGKRPGAQFSGGLMELKQLLHEMNRRQRPKDRKVRSGQRKGQRREV